MTEDAEKQRDAETSPASGRATGDSVAGFFQEWFERTQIPRDFETIRVDRHAIRLRDLEAELAVDWHQYALEQRLKPDLADMPKYAGTEEWHKGPPSLPRPLTAPRTDRFFAGAPAPAFQAFRRGLRVGQDAKVLRTPEEGRRVFVLLAERGIGRGQFFAALGGRDRFRELCVWLGLGPKASRSTNPSSGESDNHVIHIARINLGLSHEVLSAFDRLSDFIFESCSHAIINDAEKRKLKYDYGLLKNDRIERLNYILGKAASSYRSGNRAYRMIITINHANILFEHDHRAKNAQAQALFRLLIDPRFDKAPIDLLMLMNEETLPSYFHQSTDPRRLGPSPYNPDDNFEEIRFCLLEPDGYPEDLRTEMRMRLDRLSLNYFHADEKNAEGVPGQSSGFYLHVLRRTRPEVFALRFFPRAAMVISRIAVRDGLNCKTVGASTMRMHAVGTPKHLRWFQFEIRRQFEDQLGVRSSGDPSADVDYGAHRIATVGMMWSILFDYALTNKDFFEKYKSIGKNQDKKACFGTYSGFPYPLMLRSVEKGREILKGGEKIGEASKEAMKEKSDKEFSIDNVFNAIKQSLPSEDPSELNNIFSFIDQKYRWLVTIVGHHRFALTAILAACEDVLETERRYHMTQASKAGGDGLLNALSTEFTKGENEEFNRVLGGQQSSAPKWDDWRHDEIEWTNYSESLKGIPPCNRIFGVCTEDVDSFLNFLRVKTAGTSPEEREDIAIHEVLTLYRKRHRTRNAWPFDPRLSQLYFRNINYCSEEIDQNNEELSTYLSKLDAAEGDLIVSAYECLLLHLALIGQPVEADTLLQCPEVDLAVSALVPKDNVSEPGEAKTAITNALLDLLVHRCLVFRVRPKGLEHPKLDETVERFAVHKSIRRYFYRRFDAKLVDYLDVEQFTVSLYATHPNDLPRPGAETHQRIERTIRHLIGFERELDIGWHVPASANIRAANGILRSIYSVGVVSRFNTFQDLGVPQPDKGYLENHRQLIRWLLNAAVRLDEGDASESNGSLSPLYPEETVWLFNECGVISLVQGKLLDAADLFQQARYATRRMVEPNGAGPLHNRVELNFAICQIEQGRAILAEEVLRRICAAPDEHQSLRLIARGYLALIDHLRGRDVSARESYELVERELSAIGRMRAASIFTRHHADLLRSMGREHLDRAQEKIDRAINFAADGQHEDVRHHAQISRLKIGIANGSIDDMNQARGRLESVDEYARKIGVPRLQYEVSGVRALLLLRHGDAVAAQREAFASLKIANRNGLTLRTISSLIQLAQAMKRLGDPNNRAVLLRAMRMASEAEFFSARDSAETMFGRSSGGSH